MSIAAVTSSISMLEVPVSYAVEAHNVNRNKATWLVGLIVFAISSTICLNFEALFGFVITLTTERAQPCTEYDGVYICWLGFLSQYYSSRTQEWQPRC